MTALQPLLAEAALAERRARRADLLVAGRELALKRARRLAMMADVAMTAARAAYAEACGQRTRLLGPMTAPRVELPF